MTAMDHDARANQRRALLIVAEVAGPPAVVLGAVGLLGGWIVALVVLVVVAGAVAGWLWFGADGRIAAKLGGSDADAKRHARFVNMVEGLSAGVGVAPPRLVVVDDPGRNMLAAGRDPRRCVLVATTGLLAALSPIELEGVVAEELVRIRRRDTLVPSLTLPLGTLGRRLAGPVDDTAADLRAVTVTRYPPGLAAALEHMSEGTVAVGNVPAALNSLWLAAIDGPAPALLARPGLEQRAEALREL